MTLSRAIIAPRDLLLDTQEAQRLALFFDFILTWPLDRVKRQEQESARLNAELEYLASKKVVVRCGFETPSIITFQTKEGKTWDPFSFSSENCDIVLPFQAVTSIPEHPDAETNADRVVRHISGMLNYADAPVTAHLRSKNLPTTATDAQMVEFTLNRIPIPPTDIPWDDLIQFREEEESKRLLRKLRLWLQERAVSGASHRHVEDELESLLDDYRQYMKLQHIKYGEGVLSTMFVATTDAIADLMNFKPGDALRSLFDFRSRKIALLEAELSAPGREVSYIAKAHREFG